MQIGDLSRQTGVNIETIRYYERIGVLPKPRATAGSPTASRTTWCQRDCMAVRASSARGWRPLDARFETAVMQRSSQRTERFIASSMRAWSGDVVAITSSSCMMMSEPMEFWRDMECSGVSSLSKMLVNVASAVYETTTLTWECRHAGSRSARLLP